MEERNEPQHISGIALLEAVILVLGVWMIASTYALRLIDWTNARENNGIFGAALLGLGLTRLAMSGPRWWWIHGVTLIVGIWLIVSPFLLGYSGNATATLNSIIVGVIVILVEAVGLLTSRREQPARAARA